MSDTSKPPSGGHIHPISRAIFEIRSIFEELGFAIAVGPELETEHYNFDAMNIPADHPARDMQDTFWLKPDPTKSGLGFARPDLSDKSGLGIKKSERKVLRTHTSPVQVRYMEQKLKEGIKPPYKIIVPGNVIETKQRMQRTKHSFFRWKDCMWTKKFQWHTSKGHWNIFSRNFLARTWRFVSVQAFSLLLNHPPRWICSSHLPLPEGEIKEGVGGGLKCSVRDLSIQMC